MKDYYRILQITQDASQEEVKKAYRKLAKVHHPDVAGDYGREEEQFQELNEAYSILRNTERRARYDWLRTNRPNDTPTPELATQTATDNIYSSGKSKPVPFYQKFLPGQERIQPYLRHVHLVTKIAIGFCLLLLVDFILPMRARTDKAVYIMEVLADEATEQKQNYAQIKTWLGRKVKVSKAAGKYFTKNPQMLVYTTPIFAKPRYVSPASKTQERYLIGASIYGNFAFVPLIMLLVALIANLKKHSPGTDFSLGVVSAILLLICTGLLLF